MPTGWWAGFRGEVLSETRCGCCGSPGRSRSGSTPANCSGRRPSSHHERRGRNRSNCSTGRYWSVEMNTPTSRLSTPVGCHVHRTSQNHSGAFDQLPLNPMENLSYSIGCFHRTKHSHSTTDYSHHLESSRKYYNYWKNMFLLD